jgi:hypothetical protein
MIVLSGGFCCLAVRTGDGLLAVDAEGDDRAGHGATGVEILEQWESYTAGVGLPQTLRAQTSGGGIHLLYQLSPGVTVGSRNRVLPNVDIKCEGGYIVCPPAEGRRWVNWGHTLEVPGDDLLQWLVKTAGTASSGGTGRNLKDLLIDGVVPTGSRYEYTRNLVYKLRKSGVSRQDAERICRAAWEKYQQPPEGVRVQDGVWYMPWSQVLYELDRAERRVPVDQGLTFSQRAWLERRPR